VSQSVGLALVATTLAAACSANPRATTQPSAAPTATPLATLAIGSVPAGSALPSNLFPCDLSPSSFVVSLHTPHGIVDARGLAAPATPAASASSVPTTIANAGELVGAQSYTVDFALDLGARQQPVAPRAIQASVSMPGSAQPATVDLHDTSAGIGLPDGKGAATLTIALTIANDPCPDLLATVQVAFRLVAATTAAACPTGQPGYVKLIRDLDPRLTFAELTRPFAVQTFVARYFNVAGADQIPPFAGYNPTAPAATVDRGRATAITSAAKGIALTGGTVQTWRRGDVVGSDGKLRQSIGDPIANDEVEATSGTIAWPGPTKAGDYVVGVLPTWSQACMTGSGYVFLSVTVK
jgi:hypothetical protein